MERTHRYCTHIKHRLFGAPASVPANAPPTHQHPPPNRRDPSSINKRGNGLNKNRTEVRRGRSVSKKPGIKECVGCLQRIVYSLDHFEAAEELQNAVRNRVQDLLPYAADIEIKTSGSSIAKDRLAEGVDRAFQSLQARIGELLSYSNGDSQLKLPEYLSTELKAYTSAKKNLEFLKSAAVQSILERLNPGTEDVRHRNLGRAWTPNKPLYTDTELSEKQQGAIDEAKQALVTVSRKLCKEQIPKALRDQEMQSSDIKLVQTEDLMGKDGIIGPPTLRPPQRPAKAAREINPVALEEWNSARKRSEKLQVSHARAFSKWAEVLDSTSEENDTLFRRRRNAAGIL